MTQVNSTNSTQGTGSSWDNGQGSGQTENENTQNQNTQSQDQTNTDQSAKDAEQVYKETKANAENEAKENSSTHTNTTDTDDGSDYENYNNNSSTYKADDSGDDYDMQRMDSQMDPDTLETYDDTQDSFAQKLLKELENAKNPPQMKAIVEEGMDLDIQEAVDETIEDLAEDQKLSQEEKAQQQKNLQKLAKLKGSEKLFTHKQITNLINKSKTQTQKQLAVLEEQIKEEFSQNKDSKKLNMLMKQKDKLQKFLKEDVRNLETKAKKQFAKQKGQQLTNKGLKSKGDGFGKQSLADTFKSKFKGLFKNEKMSSFNKMSAEAGHKAGPLSKEEKQKYVKEAGKHVVDGEHEYSELDKKQHLANLKSVKDLAKEQALKQAIDPKAEVIEKQGQAHILANLKTYEGNITKKDGTKWTKEDTESVLAKMCGEQMQMGAACVDAESIPTEKAFLYAVSSVHKRVRDGEEQGGEPSEAVAFLQGAFQSQLKGTYRVDGTTGRVQTVYFGKPTATSKAISKEELIESKHKSLSGLAKINGTYSEDFVGDFDQQYEDGDISGADARNRDIDNVKV